MQGHLEMCFYLVWLGSECKEREIMFVLSISFSLAVTKEQSNQTNQLAWYMVKSGHVFYSTAQMSVTTSCCCTASCFSRDLLNLSI